MKKLAIIIFGIILSINTYAQKPNYKVFPFKTGIIKYKLEGNSSGTHTKYIDQYGYKQADFSETEMKVFGMSKKENKATILIGPKAYSIDYDKNKATSTVNPVYETYANSKGSDYDKLGRDALKSLGYSNTNKTESIVGKRCELWTGSLGKVWIWKGLALKTETNVLGVSVIETATSVRINISVPASKFEIPKGMDLENIDMYGNTSSNKEMMNALGGNNQDISPEEMQMMQDAMNGDTEGMMKMAGKNMSQEEKDQVRKVANMSYSEFKRMVKQEEPNISEEEIKQAYQMTKQMAKYVD